MGILLSTKVQNQSCQVTQSSWLMIICHYSIKYLNLRRHKTINTRANYRKWGKCIFIPSTWSLKLACFFPGSQNINTCCSATSRLALATSSSTRMVTLSTGTRPLPAVSHLLEQGINYSHLEHQHDHYHYIYWSRSS